MKAFKWLREGVWALEAFDPGKFLLRKYELRDGWLCQVTSVGFEASTMDKAERLAPQLVAASEGRVLDAEAAKATEAAKAAKAVVITKTIMCGLLPSIIDQLIENDCAMVERLGLRGVAHALGKPDKNGDSLLTLTGALEAGLPYEEFEGLAKDAFGIDIDIKQKQ